MSDQMRMVRLDRLARQMGAVEVPAPPPVQDPTPKPLKAAPLQSPIEPTVKLKNGQIVRTGSSIRLKDGRSGTVKAIGPHGIQFQPRKK